MVFSFETEELQAICENEEEAKQKLSMTVAFALQRRLADLVSATTVMDLVAVNLTTFTDQDGQQLFGLELEDGYKLIFCSAHVIPKLLETGSLDWSKTKRVKILRISNQ